MPRAATDVMQSLIIFSAVLDAVGSLKRASGGLPNQLLRDVQAIHANVTFADLPKELQDAIAETTRTAFTPLPERRPCAVGPRQQDVQAIAADGPCARAPAARRWAPADRRGPLREDPRTGAIALADARRRAGPDRGPRGRTMAEWQAAVRGQAAPRLSSRAVQQRLAALFSTADRTSM